MATKGQIAEQVLRIVNGGDITDDSKVTMQEVGILLEHERDALVRKTVLENATLGEHEIPNEFLSVHKLELEKDSMYGAGGRPFVTLPQTPINMPNDGSIYRVCKLSSEYEKSKRAHTIIQAPAYSQAPGADHFDIGLEFEFPALSVGSTSLGKKFVCTFKHGPDDSKLKERQFTFEYLDFSSRVPGPTEINSATIRPDFLVNSLIQSQDFREFCESYDFFAGFAKITGDDAYGNETYKYSLRLISHNYPQSFGEPALIEFDIKSALTGASVISANPTQTGESSNFIENVASTNYPINGFSFSLWYPKNTKLYSMEGDSMGVKVKNSSYLNFVVELTQRDLGNNTGGEEGYMGVSAESMAKMWANKYRHMLSIYGLDFEILAGGKIKIIENEPLGGFSEVSIIAGLGAGTTTAISGDTDTYESMEAAEVVNYNTVDCYNRMPNPGMSSKMYDDAILLSGRKYWYRQEGRLYLYNEHYNSNIAAYSDGVDADIYKTNIAVWMLAKSDTLSMHDEFPMPSDAISETIKSLVATFGMMRAAKEDNINNNVDNT
tara:strand:+ start:3361 stop:5010 length:1650 start_codon:yes stop_codon:yes gene_type:complete